MNSEAAVRDAIHATIAKTILKSLDDDIRHDLIEAAIVKVIDSYDFRNGVDKVVAQRASEIATGLAQSDDWSKRIEETIRSGFEDYLEKLRSLVPRVLATTFHGDMSQGHGNGSPAHSLLRGAWPKKT